MADLTEKQQRFVDAFLGPSRGDALDAARRAGYVGDEHALERAGQRNLENEHVQAAIRAVRKEGTPSSSFVAGRPRFAGTERSWATRIARLLERTLMTRRIVALGNPRLRILDKLRRGR